MATKAIGASRFKGIVAPARSYDIAPPVDAQVIEIHFKPGEYVEKGKLLFTLDSKKEELELERDKALFCGPTPSFASPM